MLRLSICLIFLFFLSACRSIGVKEAEENSKELSSNEIHFSIKDTLNFKILTIKEPYVGAGFSERYVLYSKNIEKPKISATEYIQVPIKTCAINSTTHLGFLNEIGKVNTIIGASNLNLYYDSTFQNRISNEKVKSIGTRNLAQENLIQLNADVLFSFAIDPAAYKNSIQLRKIGINVVLISEYMESSPLKKAEWLKVFAIFYGKESTNRAESIYNEIENNYLELKLKSKFFSSLPSVTIGYPWKGTWYVSGGTSYQAQLIKDAGGNFIWNTTEYQQEGSIPLSMEKAFQRGLEADIWINPGSAKSYNMIAKEFEELKNLKSYKESNIYTNFKRSNVNGANDYWEQAVVRPDLVLKDLVEIFHSKETKKNLFYYKQLN